MKHPNGVRNLKLYGTCYPRIVHLLFIQAQSARARHPEGLIVRLMQGIIVGWLVGLSGSSAESNVGGVPGAAVGSLLGLMHPGRGSLNDGARVAPD